MRCTTLILEARTPLFSARIVERYHILQCSRSDLLFGSALFSVLLFLEKGDQNSGDT